MEAEHLASAFSGEVRVNNVLLRLDPDTAAHRLRSRERDDISEETLVRQRQQSDLLAHSAPPGTIILDITGKAPQAVARELLSMIGWISPSLS